MFSTDQVHIVNELFEKYSHLIPSLDRETFYRDQYRSDQLTIYAAFYDELVEAGISFKLALSHFHEYKDPEKKLYFYLLMALACLHPDEMQKQRLLDVQEAIKGSLSNIKKFDVNKELDLNKVSLNMIKHHPDALKAFDFILPQGHEKWMNYVVKNDDADLALNLLDSPGNILTASNMKSRLKGNPRLRRLIYGTSKHSIKDMYEAYSYAFSENFSAELFRQKSEKNFNHPDLGKHAELILATCFYKLDNAGRYGGRVDAGVGQEAAMATVLKHLTEAGADWYKAWCASREYDYIPALMDMQMDSYTDEERLLGYFTDSRIYSLSADTMKEAARRVLTQSFSPELMCEVFSGRHDSEGTFRFFFEQTKNPLFLSMIKSNQVKREILSQGLDL